MNDASKVRRSAARHLVDLLVAHDVDRIFAVPGESYLPLLDALIDEDAIDLVTCRHEGGAGFMAVSDAKLTGRAGVMAVSRGPGATNASIAIHVAEQDAVPLVVLIGHVPTGEIGRGGFQEIDYQIAFGGMAKGVWTILAAEQVDEVVARAFAVATGGTPGPVVVVLPEDVLEHEASSSPIAPRRTGTGRPGESTVAEVAELLETARRPLVIAGGALGARAGREALRAVADRFAVPVALACKCQDFLDNEHPSYAAHLGFNVPEHIVRELARADAIVAVGTRLGEVTTQAFRLPQAPEPSQRLVHVHPDHAAIGRMYRTDVACVADPVAFMQALADHADGATPREPTAERRQWREHLRATARDFARFEPRIVSDGVDFGAVVTEICARARQDAVVSMDVGNFSSWLHRHWIWRAEQTMVGCIGGAMGIGTPGAIAAALREPGRQVLCFVGDGGFLMTGNELAVARARGLNLKVFVSNNGTYGTIRLHQEKTFPRRVNGTDLTNPDFELYGRAFGATTFRIDRHDNCESIIAEAMATEGLVLVEVMSGVEGLSANVTLDQARQVASAR